MIFAELQYEQHYSDVHAEIVELLERKFENVQHGLQGDSWIWILEGEGKVAIDTFSSMQHQVKCEASNEALLHKVLAVLETQFSLRVFTEPELEPHEDI